MAELVHRPDDAQDMALTGILKEPHEPDGRMPAYGELHECHRRRPGLSGEEHEHEPCPEPCPEPDHEPVLDLVLDPDPAQGPDSDPEPEPESNREPERPIIAP